MNTISIVLGSRIDYIPIPPVDIEIESNIEVRIELHTISDAITLEHNDTVLLLFSPEEPDVIDFYEVEGEYIRENVTVYIMDLDCKQIYFG